jgi:hypothetical protein
MLVNKRTAAGDMPQEKCGLENDPLSTMSHAFGPGCRGEESAGMKFTELRPSSSKRPSVEVNCVVASRKSQTIVGYVDEVNSHVGCLI